MHAIDVCRPILRSHLVLRLDPDRISCIRTATAGINIMFGWSKNLMLAVATCVILLTVQNGRSVAVANCVEPGDQPDLNYCASQLGEVIEAPPHEAPATEIKPISSLPLNKQPQQVPSELTIAKHRSSDYDLGKDVEINMIAQLFNNETSPFYLRNRTESPGQEPENPPVSGNASSVPLNVTAQPTSHLKLNDTILHSYNLTPPKNSSVIALFIFGDSTADAGNNAELFGSLANAKHKPYGLDFDTHQPTGRFSNGRLSADYLADALRLPLIRPYLELANVYDFMHGVNFASAGAGIFDLSGYDLGARITFAQQVHNFMDVVEKLNSTIGQNNTSHLVAHSLFYISIGSNDFLHNYLLNYTAAEINHNNTVQPIEIYSSQLVIELSRQIQRLYLAGGRKFAVMGIGPLGCTPHYLYAWGSKDGSCILPVNNLVQKFNGDLKKEILQLNIQLLDARIVIGNVFDILFRITLNPDSYGFMTANTACCGVQKFGGALPCALVTEACADPEDFLWWDEYHPTDKANLFISARIWGGVAEDCFPSNVSHLVESPL